MDRTEVPFVGRRDELEAATRALDPTSGARFLLVSGEPGIGKSRLLDALVAAARAADVAVGSTRPLEAVRGQPYEALAAAVEPIIAEPLEDLLAGADDDLDGEGRREQFFGRLIAALGTATAGRRTLLAVDDLHWADLPTVRFLERLGATEPVPGLLVALAYRSAEIRPGEALTRLVGSLTETTGVVRIELAALAADDIAELAGAVTGQPLPDGAVADLVEESRGNPLFAVELARSLDLADGGLDPHARPALPTAVRAAVLARMARLPDTTAEVLGAAAVLGGTFAVDVVATVLERASADILADLDAAELAALVEPTGDPAVLSFSHPLVCRIIYEGLTGEARARRHLAAAQALSGGMAAGARLATIAYHYGRASPVAGLGPAVDYGRRAADHALARLAFEDAARLYGDVLEMAERSVDTDPVERCEVLLRRAEALDGSGETIAGRAAFAEAADLAASLGEVDRLARGALGRAGYRGVPGAPDLDAIALLDRSMAMPARDPQLRAQVTARLAMELYYLGEQERRDELSASAVALARQEGDGRALARVLVGRYYAVNQAANRPEREALATEAARLAEAHADPHTAMLAHYLLVRDRLERADRSGAEAAADRLRELAGGARRPLHLWRSMLIDSIFAHLDGDLEQAEAVSCEAFEMGSAAALPNAWPCHVAMLFVLRTEAGRLGELVDVTRDCRAQYPSLSTWGSMFAWCQLAAGDDAGARASFDASMATYDDLAEDEGFLSTSYALSQLAVAFADERAMAALRRRLAPHRDTVVVAAGPTVCTGPVTLVLAGLAGACGDLDEARALLGTAGAQADQLESPLFRAHVATALAELDAAAPDLPSGLSRREAEVLGLLAAGLTNKEVAARLHVGVRTVDSHVSSIYRKVGARRRGEAVAFAMAHGLDAGGRSDAGNP